MKLSEFVKEHRMEIDALINSIIYRPDGRGGCGTMPNPPPTYSDAERSDWVESYEILYRMWKRS